VYRLQKYWLQTTFSLIFLLLAGPLHAAELVQLYSALGEPLIAEVPLQKGEQVSEAIRVEGTDGEWSVLPVFGKNSLLLLSGIAVESPILQLVLHIGEKKRELTLFLDPVAPHTVADYLQTLLIEQRRIVEQSHRLQQQLEQLQLSSVQQSNWLLLLKDSVKDSVASRWGLFLLLGGLAALLLMRWWRAAEPVDLAQLSNNQEQESQNFLQAVEQIEQQIQRPSSKGESV
jgi:hypothetical protein